MDLTQQAIAHIQDTSITKNRPAFVMLPDNSGRMAQYDDQERRYKVSDDRFIKRSGAVSTVESLLALVKEEGKLTSRPTGYGMRVTFTGTGAEFNPDVEDGRHAFTYGRKESVQLRRLREQTEAGAVSHKDFLRFLAEMGPYLEGGLQLQAAYRRVTLFRNSKLTSQPLLTEGARGGGYEFEVTIDGAAERVPQSFVVNVPFTRGGEAVYPIPVEVEIEDEDGELTFSVVCPTINAVADQAILAELSYLRGALEDDGMGEVLVVINF